MSDRLKKAKEMIDSLDDVEISFARQMLKTACVRCDIRRQCEFAYDLYNVGVEPKIDCLAAK